MHVDPNITINIEVVTPALARQYLENNPINRRPSEAKIREYARDMENGNFLFSGHTVCFSSEGKLLDGQQRLMACVKANASFFTIVVRGLSEEVIKVIDSGKKRTYADQLKMDGYTNPASLASAVKMLALIGQMNPKDSGFTITQLNSVFEKHPQIAESVNFCKGTFKKADPILSAIHYIAGYTGYTQKADAFIQTWKGGIRNYENDPIVYIRERLYEDLGKVKKMTTVTRMRYIMYSWQKFRDDQQVLAARPTSFHMDGWNKHICGLE